MKRLLASIFLWYLRIFAKLQLFKFRPIVIGVGGASGKSSLAGLIALVLKDKSKVLESAGRNSETGIPLSVLRLKMDGYSVLDWLKVAIKVPFRVILDWKKFDLLIAEMGIDGPEEPRNMKYLLKIVNPKIAALTNISYEHSVYFEGKIKDRKIILELIKNEELRLLRSLPSNGLAILNIDDPSIKNVKGIEAKKIRISAKDLSSDIFIEKIETDIKSFRVNFMSKGKKFHIKILQPLPDHFAYSFAMAIAVALRFGINVEEAIKSIESNFSLPPGRMSVFKGKKDTILIDSSYNNATLSPIIDILDLLKRIARERRKVAIIGDMRELGIISGDYHEKIAEKLLESTDLVILIGPLTQKFVAPILKKHKHSFYSFLTFSDAKNTIKDVTRERDIILVKGSQNTLFLERAVEMLLKNPEDKKMLCRRGNFWDKKRKQTP